MPSEANEAGVQGKGAQGVRFNQEKENKFESVKVVLQETFRLWRKLQQLLRTMCEACLTT